MELFRVLQRANLSSYYDAFMTQGGDDVSQLAEADNDEFIAIMRVVGMVDKPLHIRRLQKALEEWKMNPDKFCSGGLDGNNFNSSGGGSSQMIQTSPLLQQHMKVMESNANNNNNNNNSQGHFSSSSLNHVNAAMNLSPSLIRASASLVNNGTMNHVLHNKSMSAFAIPDFYTIKQEKEINNSPIRKLATLNKDILSYKGVPVSMLPNATLSQEQRIEIERAAEEIIKYIPEYPVKEATARDKKTKELMNVITMPSNYPTRLSSIYKYSAIYGRFDRPRKTGKAMNHHEVAVNEAAAQLSLRMPSLLSRREDLYPLARQVVRIADDACKGLTAMKKNKKRDTSSINTLANQISAFYANDPQSGMANLQEKIGQVKNELSELVEQHDKLRETFLAAKSATGGQAMMLEVQKQIDSLTGIRQTKMGELARLIQEMRRFRLMLGVDEGIDMSASTTTSSSLTTTAVAIAATSQSKSHHHDNVNLLSSHFGVFPGLSQMNSKLHDNNNSYGNNNNNNINVISNTSSSAGVPFSCFPVFPNLNTVKMSPQGK